MTSGVLADAVVVVHLSFVIFAVAGGLAVLRWRQLAWLHVPAALWAALIELAGWICPLTHLEVWLRRRGGEVGYAGSFVERYVLPLVYPEELTRSAQMALGLLVIVLNAGIYSWLLLAAGRGRS